MEYVLICQSLFVRINHSDELSVVDCTLPYFSLMSILRTPPTHPIPTSTHRPLPTTPTHIPHHTHIYTGYLWYCTPTTLPHTHHMNYTPHLYFVPSPTPTSPTSRTILVPPPPLNTTHTCTPPDTTHTHTHIHTHMYIVPVMLRSHTLTTLMSMLRTTVLCRCHCRG